MIKVKSGCSLRDQQKIAERNLRDYKKSLKPFQFTPSQGCEGLPLDCFKHHGLIYRATLNRRGFQ